MVGFKTKSMQTPIQSDTFITQLYIRNYHNSEGGVLDYSNVLLFFFTKKKEA